VQVDTIKRTLKAPGSKRLRLKCDMLLSTSALKFNLRRHSLVNNAAVCFNDPTLYGKVGRCRLTLSKATLKAPGSKRLKLEYDVTLSDFAFKFNSRRYSKVPHTPFRAQAARAYTRPLFGSTKARFGGYSVSVSAGGAIDTKRLRLS